MTILNFGYEYFIGTLFLGDLMKKKQGIAYSSWKELWHECKRVFAKFMTLSDQQSMNEMPASKSFGFFLASTHPRPWLALFIQVSIVRHPPTKYEYFFCFNWIFITFLEVINCWEAPLTWALFCKGMSFVILNSMVMESPFSYTV